MITDPAIEVVLPRFDVVFFLLYQEQVRSMMETGKDQVADPDIVGAVAKVG